MPPKLRELCMPAVMITIQLCCSGLQRSCKILRLLSSATITVIMPAAQHVLQKLQDVRFTLLLRKLRQQRQAMRPLPVSDSARAICIRATLNIQNVLMSQALRTAAFMLRPVLINLQQGLFLRNFTILHNSSISAQEESYWLAVTAKYIYVNSGI